MLFPSLLIIFIVLLPNMPSIKSRTAKNHFYSPADLRHLFKKHKLDSEAVMTERMIFLATILGYVKARSRIEADIPLEQGGISTLSLTNIIHTYLPIDTPPEY